MNKKQNIQIAIIVVAFGASGFVLYNGFFKGSGQGAPPPVGIQPAILGAPGSLPGFLAGPAAAAQRSQAILPAGDQLDFDILKSQSLVPQQIEYPKLSSSTDVGIPEQNLITPDASPGK